MNISIPCNYIPADDKVSAINKAVQAISENLEFLLFRFDCLVQAEFCTQDQINRAVRLAKKMLRA